MRTLRNLLSAGCLAVSLFFSPVQAFADKETIFNQTYSVQMKSEFGEDIEEKIRVQASLDADTNILYFSTYTQDYNRKNWIGDKKQKLPLFQRHTNLNHSNSRIFVLRPQRVKISEIQQKAFVVPPYKWVLDLEPYEKRQKSQLLVETIDKTLDGIISEIPFLGKMLDKFLKDAKQKEQEHYEEIFENINKDYVATQIPPYIPKKLVGYSETAREYAIQFDTGNTQDEIPMFIWMKIALGDPSNAAYGSFPNKYGELENILIQFNLNENKIKREELYTYFFHQSELEHLNIANRNIEGTNSNPAIITVKNLEQEERKPYEADRVVRIGMAEYVIKEIGNSVEKDLTLGIVQFETKKDMEDFIKRKVDKIKHPAFLKESVMSFIDNPTIEEVFSNSSRFNEEQTLIYIDLILEYMNRTGMNIMLSNDEEQNKKLLEQLKKYQLNSETK